jgi:histidyl-tRNA synthetase
MGMERLVLLLREQGVVADTAAVDVYVVAVGSAAECLALVTTERVREVQPRLRIVQHTGGGSFKSQMKKADKSGARLALIWGEDEVAAQVVTVKLLRGGDGERTGQRTVPLNELVATLCAVFAS